MEEKRKGLIYCRDVPAKYAEGVIRASAEKGIYLKIGEPRIDLGNGKERVGLYFTSRPIEDNDIEPDF